MVLRNQPAQFKHLEAQEHDVGRAQTCVIDGPPAVIDQQPYVAKKACDIGGAKAKPWFDILLGAAHGCKELSEVFLKIPDTRERRQFFGSFLDCFTDLIKICLVDVGESFLDERA